MRHTEKTVCCSQPKSVRNTVRLTFTYESCQINAFSTPNPVYSHTLLTSDYYQSHENSKALPSGLDPYQRLTRNAFRFHAYYM
jgi:hypothetical protein